MTVNVRTASDTVDPIVLTESNVYVRSNITKISEPGTDEQPGFEGYSYDETEYAKDEFIALQAQQTNDLSAVVDDLLILMPTVVGGVE